MTRLGRALACALAVLALAAADVRAQDVQFRHLGIADGLPSLHVSAIHRDRRGFLWIGTGRGLSRYDGNQFRTYTHAGTGGADPGGTPRPGALPAGVVLQVYEDRAGTLWVVTPNALSRYDAARDAFVSFLTDPAGPHALVRVVEDGRGTFWVGTGAGLYQFDRRAGTATPYTLRTRPRPAGGDGGAPDVWALHVDRQARVWVGARDGLYRLAPGSRAPDGGTPDAVAARYAARYAERRYATVAGDPRSLSYNAAAGFGEDRAGHVWVATDGGGLNRLDPATGRFTRYTPETSALAAEAVLGVLEGREGALWLATFGRGLARFDPRQGREPFRAYTTATSAVPSDFVYEVQADRAGRVWVGADNGVVAQFDPERGVFTRRYDVTPPGLVRSPARLVRELRDGRLAVGLMAGGVTLLDPATGARTHHTAYTAGAASGLASNAVNALFEGGDGTLWIGTEVGLDALDRRTGRVAHHGAAEGLPGGPVKGIVPDDAGRLWLSTDRGLVRYAPGAAPAARVRLYTRADGVRTGEFLARSAFRARDGTLYFGGNDGVTAVRPARVVDAPPVPAVAITGLQLFNQPAPVGAPGSPLPKALAAFGPADALVLAHDQHNVTFEFAAPDYAVPQRVRYAYRLEGLDAEWQEAGTRHAASYTNLAPGRYTFRVRATLDGAAADAAWHGGGTALRVVVRPPWWGTWGFRLAAAGALMLGAWRLVRFRERRRVEVALGRQALHDPLTGLANRALFRDRVEHALALRGRGGAGPGRAGVAVLYLDLDGFKAVNDTLGHAAGDRLLAEVAARLLNATRGCDTVARLGGDEFAVLLENAGRPADAEAVAERIVAALRAPVAVGTASAARVGVSVGLAFAAPGDDGDALLRHADAAMYRAKAEGKGRYALFDPALTEAAAARQALERDLARAVGALGEGAPAAGVPADGAPRAEFALVYQPVVELASGAVVGAEALLRWRHPTRGVVGPAEFIPLAEASGLVLELGRWVLAAACRAAAAWPPGPGGRPVRVAVNVSARQFADPALAGHVVGALAASGLPPNRLTLEMTEGVLMRDTGAALATLGALRALGVHLAVDDFGTGYSSLAYLQQFPVDVLKIDKRFVDGVGGASDGRAGGGGAAIARTVVALGDALGLRTVAEGVETAAQAEALAAMGCALAQGYLFARPMDDAALRTLLIAGHADVPSPV